MTTGQTKRVAVGTGVFGSLLFLIFSGCGQSETGPKREDHEAAYTARYHPRVNRHATATTRPAATQPFSTDLPIDLNSENGPIGSPVLFVNGQTITVADILEPILPVLRKEAGQIHPADDQKKLAQTVGEEIRRQVRALVVYQEAKREFPEKAQEALDKQADKMLQDIIDFRYAGVRSRYEAYLASLDLKMEDMKERARRQIVTSQFLRERFDPLLQEPTRRQLFKYYHTHIDQFTTQPSAEMFLIEIPLAEEIDKPLSQATDNEISAARRRIRAALERAREELDSGVEFEAVARQYSRGIRRLAGGAWGSISPGSLTKRWTRPAEVLFTLKEGQISEITETDESLFIVKSGKQTPHRTLSFEEAQVQMIEQIQDEQYTRLSNDYVMDLLRKATIDERQQQEFFLAVATAALQARQP